jgi:hypothetical protein
MFERCYKAKLKNHAQTGTKYARKHLLKCGIYSFAVTHQVDSVIDKSSINLNYFKRQLHPPLEK